MERVFQEGEYGLKKRADFILYPAAVWACLILGTSVGSADDFAEKALKPARETLEINRQAQGEQDQWAAEKESLTAKFAALEEKKKKLEALHQEAIDAVDEKTKNIASLEQQMEELSRTAEEIEPFFGVIYNRLIRSVNDGLPFLMEERKKRLEKLDLILKDSSIKISEKFRRLSEALMVEAEYGGTLDVYPETIAIGGKEIQMRIFRLGRIALFCQSQDRKVSGIYDVSDGKWQVLPGRYNKDMDKAMEIGSKRRPAELVTLPLGRMAVK